MQSAVNERLEDSTINICEAIPRLLANVLKERPRSGNSLKMSSNDETKQKSAPEQDTSETSKGPETGATTTTSSAEATPGTTQGTVTSAASNAATTLAMLPWV